MQCKYCLECRPYILFPCDCKTPVCEQCFEKWKRISQRTHCEICHRAWPPTPSYWIIVVLIFAQMPFAKYAVLQLLKGYILFSFGALATIILLLMAMPAVTCITLIIQCVYFLS